MILLLSLLLLSWLLIPFYCCWYLLLVLILVIGVDTCSYWCWQCFYWCWQCYYLLVVVDDVFVANVATGCPQNWKFQPFFSKKIWFPSLLNRKSIYLCPYMFFQPRNTKTYEIPVSRILVIYLKIWKIHASKKVLGVDLSPTNKIFKNVSFS